MLDRDFKKLKLNCAGYKILLSGGELSKGYKPDTVLINTRNEYIILESEHGTSRKHILGGMIKAANFLTHDRIGVLIIVIQIKKNTNEYLISQHLLQYFKWIKKLTSLKEIYIVSDTNYCKDEFPLELLGNEFFKLSTRLF